MNSKDFKKIIIEKITTLLKSRGFKKSGNTFQRSNDDLTYYINVQSSQSSTAYQLRFTLNIGIASAMLYRLEDISIPEKDRRHFEKRIGDYLNQRQDKWWTVSTLQEAGMIADEVATILETKVLPEFSRLQTTNDLAELWRQNQSPGVTEKKCKEYLYLLTQRQGQ
jgi:hypothetical protein